MPSPGFARCRREGRPARLLCGALLVGEFAFGECDVKSPAPSLGSWLIVGDLMWRAFGPAFVASGLRAAP